MAVDVRVLGRPGLAVDGVDVTVSGRQLELACRLALAPRHAAPAGQLERDLWPGSPGAAGSLRVTVSRLRDAIGREHLQFRQGVYRLTDVRSDADEFAAALASARLAVGSPADRIDAYDLALSIWDGAAFEGLRSLEWVAPEANRLDELRDQALDE